MNAYRLQDPFRVYRQGWGAGYGARAWSHAANQLRRTWSRSQIFIFCGDGVVAGAITIFAGFSSKQYVFLYLKVT